MAVEASVSLLPSPAHQVKALYDHFASAGAVPDSVFLWVDIFTVNQWNPLSDLNDGKTLQRTIDLSHSTLVVLDARALPFSRLWCLYEMGSTRQDQLTLITHRAEEASFASVFASIDVEAAECFDADAKALIHAAIVEKHGSLQQFTALLRLRFLLRPQLSYEADVDELIRRADDVWRFGAVRELLQLQSAAEAREAAGRAEAAALAASVAADGAAGGGWSPGGGAGKGSSGGASPLQSPRGSGGAGAGAARRDRGPSDTGLGAGGGPGGPQAIPEEDTEGTDGASSGGGGGRRIRLSRASVSDGEGLGASLLHSLSGPAAAPSVLACVVAGSGEGKSTFSACLSQQPWVDAFHFCKHADARRQDPVLVAKTLAYQLAVSRNPDVSGPIQARAVCL